MAARSYYEIADTGRAYLAKTWEETLDISQIFLDLMDYRQ